MTEPLLLLAADEPVDPVAPGWQLVLAALLGIAVIVLLITLLKVHPFLGLVLGSATVGLVAGLAPLDALGFFTDEFGGTAAGVGILVALGAIFARLLADSGGADQVVDTLVGRASPRALPWVMAGVGALIGLPMFFEIGLVLLMPVIYLVARRANVSIIGVGIPTLAGLSAMHGFVPPHPGPVAAIDYLGADLGLTLGLGLLVSIPVIIVAGPIFGVIAGRWVHVEAPARVGAAASGGAGGAGSGSETGEPGDPDERSGLPDDGEERAATTRRPSFVITLATVLLPVILMLAKAIADITLDDPEHGVQQTLDVVGEPVVALLIGVLVAMFTLGLGSGMNRQGLSDTVGASLGPIAGIFLIVAAGGGFKGVLVNTGVGTLLADWASDADVPVTVLAWTLAVLIRLATGSATVATITASSLMIDLVAGMPAAEVSLVVLAVGAGSVFFSHVNDAGFWLVKEYFGLTVGQTIRTWSLMETVLSVTGLVVVLLIGLVV
ncbi:GntP family permease [Nocardioides sp. SYSU D00038]|uniref:GntP family permease n=1 Tax=Nocardioides sp. SYSU D00038 TaxID=2812554 RepID=UPI0019679582|nr:SLC13 family permease [Nocardioides sp. SYSU D00038]